VKLLPQLLRVRIKLNGHRTLLKTIAVAPTATAGGRRWQIQPRMDLNLGLTARRRKVFVFIFALAEGGAICRRNAAGGSGSGGVKTRRRRVGGYGDLAGALCARRHFEQFLGMLVVFCAAAAGGRVRLAVGTCRPRRRFVQVFLLLLLFFQLQVDVQPDKMGKTLFEKAS
jgi:hypothetical protein